MAITTTESRLLKIFQLTSVSLPVGGFSFSQGLEYAIECGWVKDYHDSKEWLITQLYESIARVDLPVLLGAMCSTENRAVAAASADSSITWAEWNDIALANRETKELRLTDTAMGEALYRLLKSWQLELPEANRKEYSFVALFAIACTHWQMEADVAALGFVWSWLENQIASATKLVPLGQTQAQQLLNELQNEIPHAIDLAKTLDETTLGGSLPALTVASSLHETQYSRLFRS